MPSRYKRKSGIHFPYKKIIIAMEGNKTEPVYFNEVKKLFQKSSLKIVVLKREKNETNSAPKHVIEELNKYKRENKLQKGDELWLVIDRDNWPEKQLSKIAGEISTRKYNLALSNPCFEIWLVMHYFDITTKKEYKNDKFTYIKDVKKIWTKIKKKYKIKNNFEIIARIDKAIVNADKADINKNEMWTNTPGSRVYKLASSIIFEN